MAKLPLACFLSFLISFSCLASAAPESDFNVLTLLWPGSFCNNWYPGCCRPTTGEPALDFYVQALKTYSSISGKPVTNCSSTCSFKVNPLKNVIFDLNLYWPDVRCPSNNGKKQWESNWCLYGLCSSLKGNQTAYFDRALQLRARIDPLYILQQYGIVPSDSKKYKLEDIKNALIPSIGFSFYIECNRNYFWFLESQLFKIHVCVSADAKSFISCPIPTSSNCDSSVRFVPFTGNMLRSVTVNPIQMPTEGKVVV